MIAQIVRRLIGHLIVIVVIASCLSGMARATITVTTPTSNPGNVFYTTETVSIPMSVTVGTSISWTVTDYFGIVVASGNTPVSSLPLRPTTNGEIGYFSVALSEMTGSTVDSTSSTQFTIIKAPPTQTNSPYGVQTHFADDTPSDTPIAIAPLLKKGGFTQIRDEIQWNFIENPALTFTYPTNYTDYMSAASTNGLTPLVCLDFADSNYDWYTTGGVNPNFTGPYTTTGLAGFGNYGLQVLNKFGTQVSSVEVWDEYDGSFCVGPAAANRPLYYFDLLQATWNKIKPTYPNAKIVGFATYPINAGFVQAVLQQGGNTGNSYVDIFSVHPYRDNPEGVDIELKDFITLIKGFNGGVAKPVWATEFSLGALPTNLSPADEYGQETSYLVRMVTGMQSAGVAKMFYYTVQDDGNDPHRGLVGTADALRGNYLGNPVYSAYSNAISQLYGWTAAGRTSAGLATTTYVYKYTSGSNSKYVCWGGTGFNDAPTTLTMTIPTSTATLTDIMGNTETLTAVGGKVTVPVTGVDPCYVTITGGSASAITEAYNPVIADSVAGYSNVGTNGWSYGTMPGTTYSQSSFAALTYMIWGQGTYRWTNSGGGTFITIDSQQPYTSAQAVRRWTSSVAGTASVALTISGPSNSLSTGVYCNLYVDGTLVYSPGLIAAGQVVTHTVTNVTLNVNSVVDLVASVNGSPNYDGMGLTTMRITVPQSGSSSPFVTGQSLGTLRNNYTGYLGFKFTVGSSPITVSQLGRWVVAGNTGTHTLEISLASTGAVVSGGTTTLNTSGATAGQFAYANLSAPIVLSASTAYIVSSQETSGGDQWYDSNTTLTPSSAATINGDIYSANNSTWNGPYTANHSFVPVNFMISSNTGRPFVTGETIGTARNNYTGYLGFEFTVGSTPITVSQLGRWVVSGNTGSHTLEISLASTGAVVSGGSTTVNTSGATAGQFKYASLTAPIVLSASTAYIISSQETSGGDQWYDSNTTLTPAIDATINGDIYSSNNSTWNGPYTANHSYIPVSFIITSP